MKIFIRNTEKMKEPLYIFFNLATLYVRNAFLRLDFSFHRE